MCLGERTVSVCKCVCVSESDSPRVSYSWTKVSFPFLLHTSQLCYFRAMLAELVVCRGSLSHTHTKHTQHTHTKPTGSVLERVRGAVHLLCCSGTIADLVELTEISRVTRKVKNIILHKMVKGPDRVNATAALPHTRHAHAFTCKLWACIDTGRHTMMLSS